MRNMGIPRQTPSTMRINQLPAYGFLLPLFFGCGGRPAAIAPPSSTPITLAVVEGAWPEAAEEVVANSRVPTSLSGVGWRVDLNEGVVIEDDPDSHTLPTEHVLRLDRGKAPITITTPLVASSVADSILVVRVGTYAAPTIEVGLGRSPSRFTTARALAVTGRNGRFEVPLAELEADAAGSPTITLRLAALEAPALLYSVELRGPSSSVLIGVPDGWQPGEWESDDPARSRLEPSPFPLHSPYPRSLSIQPTRASFHVRMVLDPVVDRFDLVRIRMRTSGFVRVAALAHVDGGEDVLGEFAERESIERDAALELEIAELAARGPQRVHSVSLLFQELSSRASIYEVQLVRRPPPTTIPRPDLGSRFVQLGTQTRRAVGLVPGVVLAGELPYAAQGVLAYDIALPAAAPATTQSVEVELQAGGRTLLVDRAPLTKDWSTRRIELAHLAIPNGASVSCLVRTDCAEGALVGSLRVLHTEQRVPHTVVLITSDTHRADHMGYSSVGGVIQTPFLDALARRGMRFDDATSASTITNPSHATMFTGLPVRDTGILGNLVLLSEDAHTLAEVFEAAGYRTFAATSARHLTPWRSGFGQGFERFDAPCVEIYRDGRETIEAAHSMLEDAQGDDVFLWLHLFEAHAPYLHHVGITERYYQGDPFDERLPELPPEVQASWNERVRDGRYYLALYKGEVSYLDQLLEGFFRAQPRIAAADIAFTADHGEALGEVGQYWTHVPLISATLRVPLIFAGPSVSSGIVVTTPVSNQFIGKSLLAMAGFRGPEAARFPGWSLLDEPRRNELAAEPRFVIGLNGTSAGVMSDKWFLQLSLLDNIVHSRQPMKRHSSRLFDRVADQACEHDLTEARPEEAARLRKALVHWLATTPPGGTLAGAAPTKSEARTDLVALGYTGDGASTSETALIDPACTCPECARWH
jgi:arylsulfatase A-like enzyme